MTNYHFPHSSSPKTVSTQVLKSKEERKKQLADVRARRREIYTKFRAKKKPTQP